MKQSIPHSASPGNLLLDDVERSALVASWGDFTADKLPLAGIAKYRPAATRMVDAVDHEG